MGSERPENCPVDSFQWRTGGSPGKGVATIEIAERATIENAEPLRLSPSHLFIVTKSSPGSLQGIRE